MDVLRRAAPVDYVLQDCSWYCIAGSVMRGGSHEACE